ncbi:hypothetical protein BH09VER1_BH09VER1_28640 [soil metagenome]
MFYGPFDSEWLRLKSHLYFWLKELPERAFQTPAKQDPRLALDWLSKQQTLSQKNVDDAALKMARYPRRGLPRLGRRDTYFLRERIRMILPIVDALGSESRQAREPVRLFEPPRYEGLEEQQIAWALVAYWHEFGWNRWHLEQAGRLFYAASLNGWKPSS